MIVRMNAGIDKDDERVKEIVGRAESYGLNPSVHRVEGTRYTFIEIYLRDGKERSCTISDHVFRLPGVESVEHVTPSMVSVSSNGSQAPQYLVLSPSITIGHGLPCQLFAGPCTVDSHIDLIAKELSSLGIKAIRGGCWKPRSNAYAVRGFRERAVRWLLEAAGKHAIEMVLIEVMDQAHIAAVRKIKEEVGYTGAVVIWVGARSVDNQTLLEACGRQDEFPVLIKNGIYHRTVKQWFDRIEFITAGPMEWREDGTLDEERSLLPGNTRIMLCARGIEKVDPNSPFRFTPNHTWIQAVHEQSWAPVGVDPSHSAGTMRNDLVLKNLASALAFHPDFVLIEGGYPEGMHGLCDVDQSVPLGRIPEVMEMVAEHNARNFPRVRS